jgi:hypothetical protein
VRKKVMSVDIPRTVDTPRTSVEAYGVLLDDLLDYLKRREARQKGRA